MSDKELLAQIAQLAGAINKHNINKTAAENGYGYMPMHSRGGYHGLRGRGGPSMSLRGRGHGAFTGTVHRSLTLNNNSGSNNSLSTASPTAGATPPTLQSTPSTTPTSWPSSPATQASAAPTPPPSNSLASRPPHSRPSRHLSLNVKANGSPNLSTSSTPASTPPSVPINTAVGPGSNVSIDRATGQQWVQSKGKNMSLMTAEKYEKTMVAKQKSILSMKKAKQAQVKRMQDLRKGIVTIGDTSYAKSADGRKLVINKKSDRITIDGIEFEMDARGNKLVRKGPSSSSTNSTRKLAVPTSMSSMVNTPKALSMDGVKYVRTTSGNLVRASLVRNQLLKRQARQKELAEKKRLVAEKKKAAREKLKSTFCQFFTRLGRCPKGPRCPYMHSRNHLAICKKFLRGQCTHTAATCRLSHSPSPHTVPPCVHFQRAACTKDNCLYPHIRINPKAPLCVPFAKEGWCDKGGTCKDRHAWICPDFNSPQGCHRRCGLAHVPEQGARDQPQQNGTSAPQRRGRYHGSGNNQQASQGQDVASESKSSSLRQYDENFIPFNLDSDDESELQQHAQEQEQEQAQDHDQEAQSQGLFEDVEDESEEKEDTEEMDVDSDGVVSAESDDDMEEGEEEEGEEGLNHQDNVHQSLEDEEEEEEDGDEDDYMAYYQEEEEDDRGEY